LRQVLFIILFVFSIGSVRGQASSDTIVMNYLQQTGVPVTCNNEVKLLMTGHDKFIDLFQTIRQAKHHIHLEYFNFRNDSIANSLFDLLAEKVKEGVEVRAMFDAFGNWSNNKPLKKRHLKSISDRGIEIVKFDPINFPWVNHAIHRDHRKIVVIDGKIGYTGGMNIADYYINGLPKIGKWHDMHIHLEGDAVRYLQGIFLTMWNRETGQHRGTGIFPGCSAISGQCSGRDSHRGPHPKGNSPFHQPCLYRFHTGRTKKHTNRESLLRADKINPQSHKKCTEKRNGGRNNDTFRIGYLFYSRSVILHRT